MTLVLFLAGPVVLIGYLTSSVVRGLTVRAGDRPSPAVVGEMAATVGAAVAAWLLIRWAAPGRTTFQNASAIGFLSSQVLTAWSSLAIWTGAAAVVGHVAPMTTRFRSGTAGVAGSFGLLTVFLPITALAAIGAWITSMAVTRDVRSALAATYFAVVTSEWLFAVLDPPTPYGLIHGPESTLFVAVLAGVLIARWAAGDVGITAEVAEDTER